MLTGKSLREFAVPAHTLRLNLCLHGMQDRFMTLEPGVPWVYAGGGNG